MSEYSQTYSATIAAPAAACFAVLVDFDAYPRWSSPITACRVLDRHEGGLPRRVDFNLDMGIKTLHYVLEYTWDPPQGARWKLVEGDVRGVTGSYRFEEAGGQTRATCTQEIDLGFWVPGFIRSTFEKKALRDSVEELKRAVEARSPAT